MMKKTLVALAVLGASGLAAAQSSVTLYGIADGGIGRAKYMTPDAKTKFMGSGSTVNNMPSRIGLKGTEAIGGGNVVGFAFEHGLSLEDGRSIEFAGAEPLWDSGDHFWDRDAHVFIAGGWGALKLGRQVNPTHIAEAQYDLTGLANYSAMRGTFKATGMPVWNNGGTIAYFSPNMGGLTVAVSYMPKHNNPDVKENAWDLGAWYNNGGLGVAASANKGLNDGKTNWHVGAKYSFSNFTVAGSYHSVHGDGVNYPVPLAARDAVRRGFNLSAQAKFGAATVTVDVARTTKNEWMNGKLQTADVHGNKKYTNFMLEGKYALSKRTFLYCDFLRLDGTNNWGLGINHSF